MSGRDSEESKDGWGRFPNLASTSTGCRGMFYATVGHECFL